MIERVDAGIMSVVPIYPNCIGTYLFHMKHFEDRLVHLKGISARRGGIVAFLGLGAVRPGTSRARAFIAQISKGILAEMTVLPVDLDSLGFGNCDMFG